MPTRLMSAANQLIHSLGHVWVGVPMCHSQKCAIACLALPTDIDIPARFCIPNYVGISSDVLGLYPPFLPFSLHAPVLTVLLPHSLPSSLPPFLPPFHPPSTFSLSTPSLLPPSLFFISLPSLPPYFSPSLPPYFSFLLPFSPSFF